MNIIRRHARKIKLAAVLLIILLVCGVIGQLNVRKDLNKVAPEAFAWQEESCLKITKGASEEGVVELGSSFMTLQFDYQIYGSDVVPNEGNIHIEIQSLSSPENKLIWEMVPGTMKNKGMVQIDLKAFKDQTVQMSFSSKGDFSENGGIQLENIKLSKMYMGS